MFGTIDDNRALRRVLAAASMILMAGCGTTRTTDSSRTATEQLLISDAIDRAVETVDFHPLAGQSVYLDDSHLGDIVDRGYLVSTMRQHLLASGCILRASRDQADFVVEARAGAVGTDRSDLLFGIPATNVPQILPIQAGPAAIPEVPLAKRRDQRGIAKISVFAYHRETGQPVWQSGLAIEESSSNDVWVFGAGPFQHGTVYSSTAEATGKRGQPPAHKSVGDGRPSRVDLAEQATFNSPAQLVAEQRRLPPTSQVVQENGAVPTAPQASPAEPAAFSISRKDADAEPLLPNLAELATKKKQQAELAAQVYDSQLLRPRESKTVNLRSLRDTDPIQLPQPRFDSL